MISCIDYKHRRAMLADSWSCSLRRTGFPFGAGVLCIEMGISISRHRGTCVWVDIRALDWQAPSARAVESSRGLYQAPAPEAEPAPTAVGAGDGAAEVAVDASLPG